MKRPPIALIAAQAENRVIGLNNQMPWHLPEDLQYFKRVTLGKPVIMGRKTFESIGRPLPGRTNIVVTRQSHWTAEGVEVAADLDQAFAMATSQKPEELMVIGGAQIYAETLPYAARVYLTQIHESFEGDAWFPELGAEWEQVACQKGHSEKQNLGYSFLTFDRVTAG
ncbi:MAG: dihydrofolate reductase [Cellvibrionaceae bacterium]|nr:dihydrofolate reductase [Cellvibrionaceae bacterium]|tara:strand:+ start:17673 stop:18176 length:504 start_codon:yes stop_codon:yes gene_type:complete